MTKKILAFGASNSKQSINRILADFAAAEGFEIDKPEAAPSGGVSETADTEAEGGTMGPKVSD